MRHIASRALSLAITGLLIAAGTAAAGDYSPEHLRAEGFLRLGSLDYEPKGPDLALEPRNGLFAKQRSRPRIKLEYAFEQRPLGLAVQVEAKPKLRRLLNLEVRF